MQEAEEAAAKAESERLRHLGFVLQRGIVQFQLVQRIAQPVVVVGFDRIQSGEYLRLDHLETGQRCRRRTFGQGYGVAYLGCLEFLDAGDDKTHLPRDQPLACLRLRREHADLLAQVHGVRGHQQDPVFRAQRPVDHPHQHHHADIVVEPGIDDESLERRRRIAFGRRDARNHCLEYILHALAGLGADAQRVLGVDADHIFDLAYRPLRISRRQVDFVQHRHDLDTLLDRGIAVRHGLRFHALRRVDHQHRPFAGRERARHLVGKVDVSRGVDQVEVIDLAVACLVLQRRRLRLDGDAALPLQVHGIEHLLLHLAFGQPAA